MDDFDADQGWDLKDYLGPDTKSISLIALDLKLSFGAFLALATTFKNVYNDKTQLFQRGREARMSLEKKL